MHLWENGEKLNTQNAESPATPIISYACKNQPQKSWKVESNFGLPVSSIYQTGSDGSEWTLLEIYRILRGTT